MLPRSFRNNCLLVLSILIGSLGIARVMSQTTPEEYDLSGLHWRNVGPNRGGRSLAISGSEKRPLEYYFGATGGGVWKTVDGGVAWHSVTDGKIKSSSVGALAISPSNPDVVYVGMGETELRGSVMQGDGVYKTSDGGKTWSHLGLENTLAISRIRIDPANSDLVYVAALGHPYGKNSERGVFRSKDGGKTWDKVLFKSDQTGAIDLSMDPHNPKVLFASLWQVYRTAWTLSSGGPECGLYKSVDGGDNWTEITRNPGLPQGLVGKINVSVSGADSNRVYANIEAEDGGLFRSDDAGSTWSKVNEDRNIRQRAFYFNRIQADTKNRDILYMMNVEFYKSTDGGKTIARASTPHSDHHDLWIAPNDSDRIAASDDGGGSVSVDGGKTWTSQHYPTAQFYHVTTTNDVPYAICGTQQDDGSVCALSDGGPGGGDPEAKIGEPAYLIVGGEAGYVASDPKNPNITFAGDQAGAILRYDRSTREVRNVQVNPWFFSGMGAQDLKERWQWVFPIVYSPIDSHTLYASSQHLWKSTNEGQSWERISPDLTLADPATLGDSGGPLTHDQNGPEIYGTIFSVAPSHFDIKTIWAGSDDGLVHVTRDGGQHWDKITPPDLPKYSRISMIDASPIKPATAYLAANRYEMDDRKPYLFRTDDYGKTWAKITSGIPDYDFTRSVREDTKRRGLLFAATEHGVYVSFNNGDHWQSLSLNIPDTQVSDLVIKNDDLVISTYGRAFYVLDDIDVLRQLSRDVTKSDVHLFKPAAAIRPTHSATIDYFLQHPAQKIIITILDSTGSEVRTFASGADNQNRQQGNRGGVDRNPSNKTGLNRFAWDLHYPGATVFPNMILRGGNPGTGPAALPGNYTVRLTVDGQTQTQPLTVTKDPRLKSVTDADLRAQFKLATEARDKTSQANEMVIQIREIKKQIDDRLTKANDDSLSASGKVLKTQLSSVEEALYQVRNRSPRDTLNYPIKLNNQLAVLMSDVETGDFQPTDQMYAVMKDLSADLAHLKEKLDAILKNDLSKFNQDLRNKQLPAISEK